MTVVKVPLSCAMTDGQGYSISRVPHQKGASLLYIMLEIHHSGQEHSIWYPIVDCKGDCKSYQVWTKIGSYMYQQNLHFSLITLMTKPCKQHNLNWTTITQNQTHMTWSPLNNNHVKLHMYDLHQAKMSQQITKLCLDWQWTLRQKFWLSQTTVTLNEGLGQSNRYQREAVE